MILEKIATIRTDFPTKFGVPRQSNLVQGLQAQIIFEPEFRSPDAVRGLEEFSHIWLVWGFSEVKQENWTPTVRPPRLGGNTRMGVFATRSPFRPNPLGLSAVQLKKIVFDETHGPVLYVTGADLMDKTPIYDIKPYIPYADSYPKAKAGFATQPPVPVLQVEIEEQWLNLLPPEKRQPLQEILSLDPRPSYQNNPEREYGMEFAGFEIKFVVKENKLQVTQITPTV